MKKAVALVLAGLLLAALSACGETPASGLSRVEDSSTAPLSVAAASLPPPQPGLPLARPEGMNALTGLPRAEGVEAGQRPVAILVDNSPAARPQWGLSAADVLFEMPIESGDTRFMAMFDDYRNVPQVGPVRSAQDQFVQFALPMNAIQVQIGATVYADNLQQLTGQSVVDGLHVGVTSFDFDRERSSTGTGGYNNEFCWYTTGGLISDGLAAAGIATTGDVPSLFRFSGQAPAGGQPAQWVYLNYSASAATHFSYEGDLYYKWLGDAYHMDLEGNYLGFTNLLLLECPIGLKEDGLYPEYDLRGGAGVYVTGGVSVPISWVKGTPDAPLLLYTEGGAMLEMMTGKTYVGLLPAGAENALSYEAPAA